MAVGKQMQFFGARANLAKSLLYAINGGVDEKKGLHVVPGIIRDEDEVLDYSKVLTNYKKVLSYVAELYVDTINIIHYMHDKYAYEASQMALHDTLVERLAAFGVAGLSIAADSLSAIKFAKVRPIRNEDGIAVDFEVEGDFPKYGNDDDRVDDIAVEIAAGTRTALWPASTPWPKSHTGGCVRTACPTPSPLSPMPWVRASRSVSPTWCPSWTATSSRAPTT